MLPKDGLITIKMMVKESLKRNNTLFLIKFNIYIYIYVCIYMCVYTYMHDPFEPNIEA